jgi:hypothetical protein
MSALDKYERVSFMMFGFFLQVCLSYIFTSTNVNETVLET